MNRRSFIASTVGGVALANRLPARDETAKSTTAPVLQLAIDANRQLGEIPADFIGLGYEISSVAAGVLSAKNHHYVNLVRRLGAHGVIRIGGNTADDASFAAAGRAVSAPKGTVVNAANLDELGTFLEVTDWRLIWALNLGSGNEEQAAAEAKAVAAVAKKNLLAFEIGNEPDLFGRGTSHRPKNYAYEDYLREYRAYKTAIRRAVPDAPFAGPDAAVATDWVTRFAADEGRDLKLLTHHYYRECASAKSSLDRLLHPDPKLRPQLKQLKAASAASRLPYRICEVNSLCGGGKPGVSDTFGAALWALDYMFAVARGGGTGVNIETGVNQLGWTSWYSPIADGENAPYAVKPDYYGMLAFAQASDGQQLELNYDPGAMNVTAYAVVHLDKRVSVVIVNKDASPEVTAKLSCSRRAKQGSVLRLTGPSLESKSGVMLGGAEVTRDGEWKPLNRERVDSSTDGTWMIRVPGASAAIVTLEI